MLSAGSGLTAVQTPPFLHSGTHFACAAAGAAKARQRATTRSPPMREALVERAICGLMAAKLVSGLAGGLHEQDRAPQLSKHFCVRQ